MAHPLKKPDRPIYSVCMFVRVVKKSANHVSVRIVENKRVGKKVKQKTVCCIGYTNKENTERIEELKIIGKQIARGLRAERQTAFAGIEESWPPKRKSQEKDLTDDRVYVQSLKEEARVRVGGSDIFGMAYDQLKLSECFGKGDKQREACDLLREIVLCRLESPLSKRASVSDIRRRKDKRLDLDRVYRMMDKVYARREVLRERVCRKTLSLFKERIDVVFFDVTTLYFESFVSDELRSPGFSKDNKVKEVQVVLALMTTESGLPVGYELFSGNTFEGSTLIETMDRMSEGYELRDIYLVADRGMFSKGNIERLDSRGVKFIIGARLKTLKAQVKERILTDAPLFSKRKGFRDRRFWCGEYELNGYRLIVSYSRERALKDRKDRQKILERLQKEIKGGEVKVKDLVKNRGVKKYLKLKGKAVLACIDEERVAQEALWDGFHGVMTNDKREDQGRILGRYKDLWQIEAAFRLNKHDLRMRPIYHWKPSRIRAHILICFIAYGLACFVREALQRSGIRLSFERIREELGEVQVSRVRDERTGRKFLLPSKPTDTQKAIYKVFGKSLNQTTKFL